MKRIRDTKKHGQGMYENRMGIFVVMGLRGACFLGFLRCHEKNAFLR